MVDDDGEGDHTTIQSAIDSASSGDIVRVWDGTYYENIILNKSVSLIGNGSVITVIRGQKTDIRINVTTDNVTVAGFTIENGTTGIQVGSNNSCFKDSVFINNSVGVGLTNCENSTITNNIFLRNGTAISGSSSHENLIMNNTVYGNMNNTVYGIIQIGIGFGNSRNNRLIDNSLYGCKRGITLYDCRNITSINNTIRSNGSQGFSIVYSRNITLKNNRLEGCGISLGGNSVEYWNSHDIDMSNFVNNRSVAYYPNANDVHVLENAGQIILANCTNLEIADQYLFRINVGLLIGFSSDIHIKNNVFDMNLLYGMKSEYSQRMEIFQNNFTNNYDAIYLKNCEFNFIHNNNFSNDNRDCIEMHESHNNVIENNTIFNNTFGLVLDDSNNNTLVSNVFMNNEWHGITLRSSCTNTTVIRNIFSNSMDGIFLAGTNQTNVSYNYFHPNSGGAYIENSENIEFYQNIILGSMLWFYNVGVNTSIHHNDIYGINGSAITVTQYNKENWINATYNYWGSKSGCVIL